MLTRFEQEARRSFVHTSFARVAKLPYTKYKWICFNLWIDLIRRHAHEEEIEIMTSLTDRSMKNILIRWNLMNINNISSANPNGYYLMKKRAQKRPREGDNTQNYRGEIITIMVTDAGQLPPLSNHPWYNSIITALPPNANIPIMPTPNENQETPVVAIPETIDEFTNYFLSPEARIHFGFVNPTCENDRIMPVKKIIKNRIRRFYNAVNTVHGWRDVLEDGDVKNVMTQYQIWLIWKKCELLYIALTIFYEKKGIRNISP